MKILLLAAIFSTASFAQVDEKCKPLEKLISQINNKKRYNYSSVNKVMSLSQTLKCDDGVNIQGISNIIVQSLVKDFVRTMKVASKNDKALSFVVSHVSSSKESRGLSVITENTKKFCSKDRKAECLKVAEAARAALKE